MGHLVGLPHTKRHALMPSKLGTRRAAQVLNASAPLFFDVVPVGRILNRFSKEVHARNGVGVAHVFSHIASLLWNTSPTPLETASWASCGWAAVQLEKGGPLPAFRRPQTPFMGRSTLVGLFGVGMWRACQAPSPHAPLRVRGKSEQDLDAMDTMLPDTWP